MTAPRSWSLTFRRALEPTNPWGLSQLEYETMRHYVEIGTLTKAAEAIGVSVSCLEKALVRVRQKMGVATSPQQIALWAQWTMGRKYPGPRTVWSCTHCQGLGFTTERPQ